MIDSRKLIYLPRAVQMIVAALLLGSFCLALYVAISFVGRSNGADWILFALSFAQVSLAAIVVGIVAIYSERDASVLTLKAKTQDFLSRIVPSALADVTILDQAHATRLPFTLTTMKTPAPKLDIFGRLIAGSFATPDGALPAKIWVGLNVFRIFVIYLVPRQDDHGKFLAWRANSAEPDIAAAYAAWLERDVFKFTFGGASHVGFTANYEPVVINGEPYISVWLTAQTDQDFLVNPALKLFWAQDIAMMTESFARTAFRAGIALCGRGDPGPL